ncbi:hypothetical protein [Treponema endosymbiont of Eucomonympha sp.]|uniref:hypothetical protein n=1 Tax=Treponema endosymbiont of Eucomonympha sp. TaxID=1580831 RepID=UPI00164FC0DE|nr:hypothetical protein [Treponema endosymbiont of Eucomonympha sp.]
MQSSPLPSSPPFMSGVCSSTFQSTLPSRYAGVCRRHICLPPVMFFSSPAPPAAS